MLDEPRAVNILLVDDEPKNLIALESVLASPDLNLVRATSGPDALKHLLREDFAVILLDVHMPGMDGFETAELIRGREKSRDTPIIFLTAAVRGETFVSRGYSLGAVDYIVKPLDPDILRSKVAVFVELFRKTEQVKRQADQLAETTTFLNSVLESSTEYAIVATDLDGRILAWNEGARRIYGYEAEEMVGKHSIAALQTPEDARSGETVALLRKAARGGKAEGELEHVRKNGRRFSVMVTVDRRRDVHDAPVGYVVIARDITQLKRAEQERAQLIEEQAARAEAEAARDRLQQIVDVLPAGIAIADADGRIYMSNDAAQQIMGRLPLESGVSEYGSFGVFYMDGSPCPPEELPISRAVLRGEEVRGQQLLVTNVATGERVPVLVNAAPLRDARGAPAGGVVVFQDISSIKEMERQKDEFLAAASHDLKSPLTAIKARAQILHRRATRLGTSEGAALAEGLHGIDRTASQITGMINELLDVARLQMGRPLDLDRRPTDLAELARQVASDLQMATERHQIQVESATPPIVGAWDPARLERVLANLVSNAVKYSPEGGRVTVSVKREQENGQEWAVLQVEDQGLGIPPAELPRVFERFYRGSNVPRTIEGTGLGLSGVRQIVEQHGGQVSAASQERQGSTFTVRLPLGNGTSHDEPGAESREPGE